MADVAEATGAAVTEKASPVRCPQCRCHRRVALTGDEETFYREQSAVRWISEWTHPLTTR